jgi:hypothetical protein
MPHTSLDDGARLVQDTSQETLNWGGLDRNICATSRQTESSRFVPLLYEHMDIASGKVSFGERRIDMDKLQEATRLQCETLENECDKIQTAECIAKEVLKKLKDGNGDDVFNSSHVSENEWGVCADMGSALSRIKDLTARLNALEKELKKDANEWKSSPAKKYIDDKRKEFKSASVDIEKAFSALQSRSKRVEKVSDKIPTKVRKLNLLAKNVIEERGASYFKFGDGREDGSLPMEEALDELDKGLKIIESERNGLKSETDLDEKAKNKLEKDLENAEKNVKNAIENIKYRQFAKITGNNFHVSVFETIWGTVTANKGSAMFGANSAANAAIAVPSFLTFAVSLLSRSTEIPENLAEFVGSALMALAERRSTATSWARDNMRSDSIVHDADGPISTYEFKAFEAINKRSIAFVANPLKKPEEASRNFLKNLDMELAAIADKKSEIEDGKKNGKIASNVAARALQTLQIVEQNVTCARRIVKGDLFSDKASSVLSASGAALRMGVRMSNCIITGGVSTALDAAAAAVDSARRVILAMSEVRRSNALAKDVDYDSIQKDQRDILKKANELAVSAINNRSAAENFRFTDDNLAGAKDMVGLFEKVSNSIRDGHRPENWPKKLENENVIFLDDIPEEQRSNLVGIRENVHSAMKAMEHDVRATRISNAFDMAKASLAMGSAITSIVFSATTIAASGGVLTVGALVPLASGIARSMAAGIGIFLAAKGIAKTIFSRKISTREAVDTAVASNKVAKEAAIVEAESAHLAGKISSRNKITGKGNMPEAEQAPIIDSVSPRDKSN